MQFLRGHWQLIAITVLVFALWRTPVVLPLKIFVVFQHELAHGLAAILTGGRIEEISINAQQGGHALTRGGSRFLILSAGYLGSLLLGVVLLIAALRSRADRAVMALAGAVVLLIAALYVREVFALVFCAVTGVVFLLIARFLGHDENDFVLRILGLSSLIYVPYDILSDTILRSGLRSDAFMLAEAFGGTAAIWGAIWLALGAGVILLCVRYGIGRNSNLSFATFRK